MVLYLDSNATTPLCNEARQAMMPWFNYDFGNPHAIQTLNGRKSAQAIESARFQILNFANAHDFELVFTSGASEANNLAIKGVLKEIPKHKNHVIISNIEHASVAKTTESLIKDGYLVSKISVNTEGLINISELQSVINDKTALVSIIHGNNEIGTIQDLKTISKIVQKSGALLHSDMTQSALVIAHGLQDFGLDLASFSSHKMYGPQGIGVLIYNSDKVTLSPIITGGSQQGGLRSGTIPVMLAVGFGASANYLNMNKVNIIKTLIEQREYIINSILRTIEGSKVIGHRIYRLPHNISLAIPCPNCEEFIQKLNKFIACSLGATCAGISKFSHVLDAVDMKASDGFCALRLGLCLDLTKPDLDYAINSIAYVYNELIKKR